MREEKVLTLRGKRAVWAPGGGSGPIDPKRLPEGYPYKEGEAYKITLPDDLSACENVSNYWYKVSDLTPAVSEVEKGQIVVNSSANGATTYPIKDMIAMSDENGFVLGEGHVIVALVPNYSVMGMTFPNAGIYFYVIEGNVWVTEMTWSNETIHPMAPEFLPAGVGGGGALVGVVTSPDPKTYLCNKTYSEIREAWVNNIPCFLRLITVDEAGVMFMPCMLSFPSEGDIEKMYFWTLFDGVIMVMVIDENNEITTSQVSTS